MTQLADLPNRRVEAWKYSDLRAALRDQAPPLREGRDVIERLAARTERVEIAAGEQRVIVERLEGAAFEAQAVEYHLADGAALTRVVLQNNADIALSIARVRLSKGARLRQFVLAEGGRLARIETHLDFQGEGASAELNGAYMVADKRHADLTSVVTHAVPGCETQQLTKGVARRGGRGVFQGKIVVEHGAQQTDARQYHHGLLLEAGAEILAKPELLIHADDVKCAHGNTAGALSEEALFYLRSRGVRETEARALLVEAFLAETLPEDLPVEILDEARARIRRWLEAGA